MYSDDLNSVSKTSKWQNLADCVLKSLIFTDNVRDVWK